MIRKATISRRNLENPRGIRRFSAFVFLLLLSIPGVAHDEADEKPLYTAHNLWFEHPLKMYSINYKTGAMIPAGTQIKTVTLVGPPEILRPRVKCMIHFWTMDDRKFTIYFQPKFHPGKSLKDFKNATFTHIPLEDKTEGFSKKEINAIKRGILVEGMSKEAVLIAYGPPPGHHTVTLELNRWRYWIKRVTTKDIFFQDDRTVTTPVRNAL